MAVNSQALVETRGISISMRGQSILDHVDLVVRRGEIVTLIGPNGAGKTTLVRIILGLLKPDRGEVHLAPKIHIGYVPQRLTIDPILPLTVRRFLTLTQRSPEEKLLAALTEVGAAQLLNSPLQSLSGGETQRVLLARAMLRNPDLLILDEPVQGVDVSGQQELYRLIGDIRKRHHCGILMVSHDLHLVMGATDTVLCLNRHICCSGHPDSVRIDPNFIALFDRMPMLTPYSHHHDHTHNNHGDIVPEDSSERCEHKECKHG